MFRKITVAYNGSPEAAPALAQSIHLAKALGAELCAITVQQDLPPLYGLRGCRGLLSLEGSHRRPTDPLCSFACRGAMQCSRSALRTSHEEKTEVSIVNGS